MSTHTFFAGQKLRATLALAWLVGMAASLLWSEELLAATNELPKVADTSFKPDRGFFFAPIRVTIQCATPGATIVYTINGNDPSTNAGVAVTAPDPLSPPVAELWVTNTTVLRAMAVKDGLRPTDIDTHTYIFPNNVWKQTVPEDVSSVWFDTWPNGLATAYLADFTVDPFVVTNALPTHSFTNALLSIPTLSVVAPESDLFSASNGIYALPMKEGDGWERRASLELMYPDGRSGFQIAAGVRIHGATSRQNAVTPKHSIHFSFRSEYGAPRLNFPLFPDSPVQSFDDLVFRACSTDSWGISNIIPGLWTNADATYQRDQWMRDAQLDMGHPSPHGIYVNLYLNGLYWGLYNVTEKINESFAASHFGGRKEDYDVITYEFSTNHVVTAGDDLAWNKLIQTAIAARTNTAKYWQLQGCNTNGVRNPNYPVLLDMDNFIDYMLLHIFSVATDWPNRNWWAVRQRDSSTNQLDSTGFKFLVWDQEIAIDRLGRTTLWGTNVLFERVSQPDTPGQIYDRIRVNPEFRLRFADRLQKHLMNAGALTVQADRARWTARAAEIDYAIVGESARWGDRWATPSYTREADWLRVQTFTQNIFWPSNETAAWQRFRNVGLFPSVSAPVFSQFGGFVPAGYQLTMTFSPTSNASIFLTLDGTDPRLVGGAVSPAAVVYDTPIAINSPLTVKARVRSGALWSPLVEATFRPPQDLGHFALTEIMYNPPGSSAPLADAEFLEFKNTGNATLDLIGLTIPAVNFSFPNGTLLGPGKFFVLVRSTDQALFRTKHPGVTINGLYSGNLDNGGEAIDCLDASGNRVFRVSYDDEAPWPAPADGFGFSLVPRHGGITQAPDVGADWRASALAGGSPGADDLPPAVAPVIINEVLAASTPPQTDKIELFNPTADYVDISGWWLTDDRTAPKKFSIPSRTVIGPFEFVTFDETQFNASAGSSNSFGLSATGDAAYLFAADQFGNLTGYSHGIQFAASDPGVSFGRHVNSVGDEQWPAQISSTFAVTNAGPRVGPVVINEIQYHPDAAGDEFIELKNITTSAVSLFDLAAPSNTWRLAGLGFTLPPGITVPAGGFILLVSFDPAYFVSKYNVPTNVLVLGPYSGALQNSGERLSLEHPAPNGSGWVVVDEVRYNDKAPWPAEPDGTGASLARINSAAYGNDPVNWRALQPSPGRANALASPIVFSPEDMKFASVDWKQGTDGPQVRLTFQAVPNITYSIFWSDRVTGGTWQHLQDITTESADPVIVTDTVPFGTAARFYRLVVVLK